MTIKQYNFCLTEVTNYTDPDAYVSDLALSSIWDDPEEAGDIPAQLVDDLYKIWEACHRGIKDIAAAAGLSARQMAFLFAVPSRTMDHWTAGDTEPPLYTRLMLQEALGLIGVDIDR